MGFMPPKSVTAEPEAWRRVSEAMGERRRAKGWEQKDIIDRSKAADDRHVGVSQSWLSALDTCKQTSYGERQLGLVSLAHDWTRNSIQRVLDGLDPLDLEVGETFIAVDVLPNEALFDIVQLVDADMLHLGLNDDGTTVYYATSNDEATKLRQVIREVRHRLRARSREEPETPSAPDQHAAPTR